MCHFYQRTGHFEEASYLSVVLAKTGIWVVENQGYRQSAL